MKLSSYYLAAHCPCWKSHCWLERSGSERLELPLTLRCSFGIQMGPGRRVGARVSGAGVYGQSLGRRLNISLRLYATVFQAEIYAIWHVLLKFKWAADQRSTSVLVFGLTGRRLWKLFRLLQQQTIGTAVPKSHDWRFRPQFCGTLLGLRLFWDTWKWNCRWAHKGRDRPTVCWTGTCLEGL